MTRWWSLSRSCCCQRSTRPPPRVVGVVLDLRLPATIQYSSSPPHPQPIAPGIHTEFRNNKRHFEYSATSCLQLQGGTSSTNVSSESGVKEGKLLLAKDSLDKMLMKDITQPWAKCQMLVIPTGRPLVFIIDRA